MFQEEVLNLLLDIRNHLIAPQLTSSVHIETIDTMEEFDELQQRLADTFTFDALVGLISVNVMDSSVK